MDIKKCVENASTFTDLKRIAAEYVIDYRSLTYDELKVAVIKTAPQYYNVENVRKTLEFFALNQNRNLRIIPDILMRQVLLNADDFALPYRESEEKVISIEQKIVDEANEFDCDSNSNLSFYKYVLEAAWEHNNDISIDEQNLINKIMEKTKVSRHDNDVIEAVIGKYPTIDNVLHTKNEIDKARHVLQQKGLLFTVRDSNNVSYDVIPMEIAKTIREIYKIDIRQYGMSKLLEIKYIKSKNYLLGMLEKADIEVPRSVNLSELKSIIVERISAHTLLGGFSPNDGLSRDTLSEWCQKLDLPFSGTKAELIDRIVDYYDNIKQITFC